MKKILLVDDEADVCNFMMRFFEERNFEAFSATSGNEALRILEKDRPDIILLDIKMKDRDGMEILKEIKNINKDAKVVMVTCVDDTEAMKRAKDLGAAAYITKPLVLSDLMEIVLRNLSRSRSFFSFRRNLK
ncbi:MAG: response regulator [Candidatus Omnitrophica bacterium]|nr:response regulator [Candidatus Omnitrophota bacterium]